MNKKVLYAGAPISIPYTLSGIQENVENYFDVTSRALIRTAGILRPQTNYNLTTPPCFLYVDNGQLRVSEGTLCFLGDDHALLYEILNTVLDEDITWMRSDQEGGNRTFYIYAIKQPIADGLLLRRAQGFVYDVNETVTSFYDEQLDDVTFEITTDFRGQGGTISDSNQILVGTIYNYLTQEQAEDGGFYYYSGFSVNQLSGADHVETNLPGKFADEYIVLNSTREELPSDATAGLKIYLEEDITGDFLITAGASGYRWQTNYPISAPDPILDEDLVTKGWLDNYLDELLFEVPNVINFRITDIKSIGINNKFGVVFNWGYDNITGTGSSATNEFTVTTSGVSFSTHALIGYCLWLPAYNGGTNLKISDNTGNMLYLTETDGTAFTFASSHTISPNSDIATLGWIHMNAHSYEIEAVPYINGTLDYSQTVLVHQSQTQFRNGPVRLQQQADLKYNNTYRIQVRGVRSSYSGEWTQLSAGSFSKYFPGANTTESVSYSHPYLVQYPFIPFVYGTEGDDTAITLTTSINGFTLQLAQTAWPDAEEYQIAWVADDAYVAPSFTKDYHTSKSTGRIFAVSNTTIGMYYVRIRPLIAGTQVCDDKAILEGNIYAGYSDYHNGQIIAQSNFNIKTYEGVIVYSGVSSTGDPILWNFASLQTPAIYTSGVQSLNVDYPPAYLDGQIITLNDPPEDWVIDSFDRDTIVLRPFGGNVHEYWSATNLVPGEETWDVTINVSERARRILYVTNIPFNYKIVGVDIDVKVIRDGPVHLRIYQEGYTPVYNTNTYDNMSIPATSTGQAISQQMDVLIRTGGNLIVDLYDPEGGPTGVLNANGLQGYITVYAIPATKKDFDPDVIK